jgi:hypothetical protein
MNVNDLREFLASLEGTLPVWIHDPVQGDCENVILLRDKNLYLDERANALVIIP